MEVFLGYEFGGLVYGGAYFQNVMVHIWKTHLSWTLFKKRKKGKQRNRQTMKEREKERRVDDQGVRILIIIIVEFGLSFSCWLIQKVKTYPQWFQNLNISGWNIFVDIPFTCYNLGKIVINLELKSEIQDANYFLYCNIVTFFTWFSFVFFP